MALPMQERNKPIEPPKKPAQAPFFLPTLPGLAQNPVFDLDGAQEKDEGEACLSRVFYKLTY